jgi:riboflavin synthase
MFTGIITQTSTVRRHVQNEDGMKLTFARPASWVDITLGESISTNGACLTVAAIQETTYDCFLMNETLTKTTFGEAIPATVNLERSLSLADRFGGHFVSGHIDTTGEVSAIDLTENYLVKISFKPEFETLLVPKGSVCINGVSLTLISVSRNYFTVGLIPHTLEHTTLGMLKTGDWVNLEFDMLGKYIAKIMEARNSHAVS